MKFELLILGTSAALPTQGRFPSAQLLNVEPNHYLIDCGEGTQIQFEKYKVKRSKINQIFISHLHGDHILGLPGLLSSFSLNGRTQPLQIFSPKGLQKLIELFISTSEAYLTFPINFHVVKTEGEEVIFTDSRVTVTSFPLLHRIETVGYRFDERKNRRRIDAKKLSFYNIPVKNIKGIENGDDFQLPSGEIIPNSALTKPPRPSRSFAYCSDTAFSEKTADYVKGVDLLYHEATFANDNMLKALKTKHSTATQAATIANLAHVKKLIIGHYSSRYKNLNLLLKEAQTVFSNTSLACEGDKIHLQPI